MSFIRDDVIGILLALPALFLIVLAPGYLFARLFAFPGFLAAENHMGRAAAALLVGCATMPVVLDLAGHAGPRGLVVAALILSAAGVAAAIREPAPQASIGVKNWRLLALSSLFRTGCAIAMRGDWPAGAGLHRSMQSADHVKHTAATWAIARTGTPPENPTWYEPGARAAYYYFFYNLTATATLIASPLGVVARQAAWAGVILAGVALAALGWLVHARSGVEGALNATPTKPLTPWLLTLLATTGLDILPVVLIGGLLYHVWITDYEFWDTQVTSWLNSVIWVPHHVLGLCAAWVGFLALADRASGKRPNRRGVALAGIAFASCAGMSIYVAMGAALIGAAFVIWLAIERRWIDIASWIGAGFIAAIFAAPWLASLIAGRPIGASEPPVIFEIRALPILDVLVDDTRRPIARLIAAPFAYAIEFGVYFLGSLLFWRRAGARGLRGDVARLLVLGVGASLLIGTFLRSSVLLNDLGWRVMLFAQLTTLVWTLAAIRDGLFDTLEADGAPRRAVALWTCVLLGFAADAYGLVQMRRYPEETAAEIAMAPDERAAWVWMDANLPAASVVEENPDRPRAFGYGLYGHFRASVSDHFNGILFGSTKSAVDARIAQVAPLFVNRDMTNDDAMEIATRANIDTLVFRAVDPVFAARDSWIWMMDALYSNAHMRVIQVRKRALAELTP